MEGVVMRGHVRGGDGDDAVVAGAGLMMTLSVS